MLCKEGTWFYFPIEEGVWAIGIVVHRDKNRRIRKPAFWGYYFLLEKPDLPTLEDTLKFTEKEAVLGCISTSMGFWHFGTWIELGTRIDWAENQHEWSFPPLAGFKHDPWWRVDVPPENNNPDVTEMTWLRWTPEMPTHLWGGGQCGSLSVEFRLKEAYDFSLEKTNLIDMTSSLDKEEQKKLQIEAAKKI